MLFSSCKKEKLTGGAEIYTIEVSRESRESWMMVNKSHGLSMASSKSLKNRDIEKTIL
jgi:hypothetical protein